MIPTWVRSRRACRLSSTSTSYLVSVRSTNSSTTETSSQPTATIVSTRSVSLAHDQLSGSGRARSSTGPAATITTSARNGTFIARWNWPAGAQRRAARSSSSRRTRITAAAAPIAIAATVSRSVQ